MLNATRTPSRPTSSGMTGSTPNGAVSLSATGRRSGSAQPRTSSPRHARATTRSWSTTCFLSLGGRAIGSIDHPEVLTFLSRLTNEGKGAGTVRNIRDVMRLVFKLAVRSGVVKNNPVLDIKAPRANKKEMIFLTDGQVMDLAEEIQDPPPLRRGASHREGGYPDYALLVRFASYTGLRAGEIGALRVSRINLMRRRVEVSESADEAYGKFNIGPTKTYSRRSVGIPKPLATELAPYLAGKKQNDLVFEGPEGGPLRHSNWYPRHFQPAVVRAGLPRGTRFHDLRHTYAAFLIAEGAHPRAIMERMGHSTINVTLGTYGHMFPAIDEQLDQALGKRWNQARALPSGEVAPILGSVS